MEHPRFILELSLVNTASRVRLNEQGISEQTLNEAWHLLNGFLMDVVDEQDLEPTDEQFRTLFIELCYKLVYHQMTILIDLPVQEENWKQRLERRKGDTK